MFRGDTAAVTLDHHQLRSIQCTTTHILVEAYAAGTLCMLNDDVVRRRAEYHLGWRLNSLDSTQARTVVSQTRRHVLSRIDEAASSVAIRYAVLGFALEHVRHYLGG
ncbi:hypothetical protein PTI98_005711 [Pleurotus ostreatus]|nr:hypothetical protein PTI98_005711 [Pleurotus ostreatus]